jgi:hypothetical protein
MQKTLLEMTQNILNEMDSDEVNSINDTVESQQVANIIKTCYNEMISNRDWPHLRKLVQLDSLADLEKPNYLKIPKGMKELIFFKYNVRRQDETRTVLADVTYKQPDDFLRYISNRNSDLSTVDEIRDFSGSMLMIVNNTAPRYWTSFDDTHIVTDSYNKEVDDTLQSSKTQCLAYIEPKWVHTDSAIPNLPDEAFAALEEEAKSTAFVVLKQMANQKAEQKASRQNRWLARKAWRAHGGVQYEDYGRKGRR